MPHFNSLAYLLPAKVGRNPVRAAPDTEELRARLEE